MKETGVWVFEGQWEKCLNVSIFPSHRICGKKATEAHFFFFFSPFSPFPHYATQPLFSTPATPPRPRRKKRGRELFRMESFYVYTIYVFLLNNLVKSILSLFLNEIFPHSKREQIIVLTFFVLNAFLIFYSYLNHRRIEWQNITKELDYIKRTLYNSDQLEQV